jgi:hypothetical protein
MTTELRAFQDRLPRGASNKQDRLDRTLAYLLRLRMNGNRPVLPAFLSALASRYHDGDQLRHDLQYLHHDVMQELTEKILIPFLIAAMTNSEAIALFDETAFNDPNSTRSQLISFQKFQAELARQGLQDLQACYVSNVREEWRPSYCVDGSMQKVINDILANLNKKRSLNQPMFTPEFIADSFFSDNHLERSKSIHSLRDFGGVLVIDAISMFHPRLSTRIIKSSIDAYDHIAVVVVSPIDVTTQPVLENLNKYIEDNFNENMGQAYTRFHTELDHLCEIDLGNLRSLKRWFFRAIPEMTVRLIDKGDARRSENLERWRQSRNNDQSRGIYGTFAGDGGIQ